MTLFNVMVDNVVRKWMEMTVEDQELEQDGFCLDVGICRVFFCADDGMIRSRELEWIQNALNVLIGLFRRYRIVANVAKSWTITFQLRALQSGMSE